MLSVSARHPKFPDQYSTFLWFAQQKREKTRKNAEKRGKKYVSPLLVHKATIACNPCPMIY